jgi:hypothetical protein
MNEIYVVDITVALILSISQPFSPGDPLNGGKRQRRQRFLSTWINTAGPARGGAAAAFFINLNQHGRAGEGRSGGVGRGRRGEERRRR